VVCSGLVIWSHRVNWSDIPSNIIKNNYTETKGKYRKKTTIGNNEMPEKLIEKKPHPTGQTLEQRLEQSKQELGKAIEQLQVITAGVAQVGINDPKNMMLMQKRLQAFVACVRGGGGEGCIEGKM